SPEDPGFAGNTSRSHKEFAQPLSVFIFISETPGGDKNLFCYIPGLDNEQREASAYYLITMPPAIWR
ncbi:hypothetical protein ACD914_25790, partial [Escherichia coli]